MNLPPEVPRPAAVRIVRGTLEAAGINLDDLASSTRARESKLNSEIELSEGRIQELKEKTEEVIRSYEAEIRKAREARDFGISEEERKISTSRSGLEDVERVRDFFGLSGEASEDQAGYSTTTDFPRRTRGRSRGTDAGDGANGRGRHPDPAPPRPALGGLLRCRGEPRSVSFPAPPRASRPGPGLKPPGGRTLPRDPAYRPRTHRDPLGAPSRPPCGRRRGVA